MTRKRYIKLMMSRGVQKNRAVQLANKVGQYGSYDKLWGRSEHEVIRSEYDVVRAKKIFAEFSKAISDATDVFAAFAYAYKCFVGKGDESNGVD